MVEDENCLQVTLNAVTAYTVAMEVSLLQGGTIRGAYG